MRNYNLNFVVKIYVIFFYLMIVYSKKRCISVYNFKVDLVYLWLLIFFNFREKNKYNFGIKGV